jgi:GNAT superfamily N-acetyltransferase
VVRGALDLGAVGRRTAFEARLDRSVAAVAADTGTDETVMRSRLSTLLGLGLIAFPVTFYVAPAADMAARALPLVCAFTLLEPLAIQIDIWDRGGIGPARRAVMDRADCPKTSVLGRLHDSPAGAAFVGLAGDIAMLHALTVLPHQRKQGMGGHAMTAAARWTVEQGGRWLSLVVAQDNAGGNALYASLGMMPVGHYHYRIHPEDRK